MARVHGKDFTAINVDNAAGTPADFKAQTVTVDFGVSKDTHDTTVVGEDWKTFASGLRGGHPR